MTYCPRSRSVEALLIDNVNSAFDLDLRCVEFQRILACLFRPAIHLVMLTPKCDGQFKAIFVLLDHVAKFRTGIGLIRGGGGTCPIL